MKTSSSSEGRLDQQIRQLRRARRRAWRQALMSQLAPQHLEMAVRVRILRSREGLAERGAERQAETLYHAASHVPHYRRMLGWAETGALPRAQDAALSLSDFPVMTKEERRTIPMDELIARSPEGGPGYHVGQGGFWISRTSGSTGIPTSHIHTVEDEIFWEGVATSRYLSDWKVAPIGESFSTGLFRPAEAGTTGMHSSAREPVDYLSLPGPYVRWNFYELFQGQGSRIEDVSDERQALYEAMLRITKNPAFITGAPSRMLGLAQFCRERGHSKRPAAVFTMHEPLQAGDRKILSDTFGCPVVSIYSLSDVGSIAWECRAQRLHFEPDLASVEILDDQDRPVPAGQVGRIVLTSLSSRVMPVIRYDSGDLAALCDTRCSCGNDSMSTLAIEGRRSVHFLSADQRTFEAYLLLRVFDTCGFANFQIVQDQPGQLQVLVPPDAKVSDGSLRRAEQGLMEVLGVGFQLKLDTSGAFVLTPSGKRNPAIQRWAEPA